MALVNCSECGKSISDKAASCPNCGAPQTTSTEQKTEESAIESAAQSQFIVSRLWTFFFGFFYFIYKGWWKSGFAYIALTFVSGGFWWLLGPLFAPAMVQYFEK
jgi:hypothetical protein